jgi:hypothetical protein
MSYTDSYTLADDPTFRGRVTACVSEQAKIFVNDERPNYTHLATAAIADPKGIAAQFALPITTQPGITTDATDGDLLAAVQFLWPTIGQCYVPTP